MVKRIQKTYVLGAADADWYADNATGATITLLNTSSPDGQAYKVAILNNTANSKTGINFTITGTDQDGRSQSEVLAGPDASDSVNSVYYYKTVTSITLSATLGADTVDIGTTTQFSSPTIPVDYGSIGAELSVDFGTATINYTVQTTSDNVQVKTPPFYWNTVGSPFTGATAVQNGVVLQMGCALRLITASYSSTPTVVFSILQARN